MVEAPGVARVESYGKCPEVAMADDPADVFR